MNQDKTRFLSYVNYKKKSKWKKNDSYFDFSVHLQNAADKDPNHIEKINYRYKRVVWSLRVTELSVRLKMSIVN